MIKSVDTTILSRKVLVDWKMNNRIKLNEKVTAQVGIKSIQIMCYDFYNIFYRKSFVVSNVFSYSFYLI